MPTTHRRSSIDRRQAADSAVAERGGRALGALLMAAVCRGSGRVDAVTVVNPNHVVRLDGRIDVGLRAVLEGPCARTCAPFRPSSSTVT